MNDITLVLPYYRNPAMLLRQAEEWKGYPEELRVLVVDDGSPVDPAHEVLPPDARASVYRITEDISWNRNGARNTGAKEATTPWVLHTDIDHILPAEEATKLVARELDPRRWYRFARYRVGAADDTRKKDHLSASAEFGQVKAHTDSFLCTRGLYWQAGGYDEDFSGSLGGSSLFLKHLGNTGEFRLLDDVALHVYTTKAVEDASDVHLDRDRSRYERIRAEKKAAGDPKPTSCCRLPYERVR